MSNIPIFTNALKMTLYSEIVWHISDILQYVLQVTTESQQQIDEEEDFIFYIPYQSNNCNVSSLPTRGSENIHFGAMLAIQVLLSKGKELEALCLSSARPLNFHFLRSTESLALALVLIDSCLPPCLLCLSTPW